MAPSFASSLSGAASSHEHGQVLSLKHTERFVWHLRDDVKRAILCEVGEAEQAVTRLWLLHPTEAVVLALFNGERSVEDVERALQYLFDLDRERACALTGKVVSHWSQALGPASEQRSPWPGPYDPARFIVPADQVDLVSTRLYKPIGMVAYVSEDCMRDCIYCNVQKRKTKDVQMMPVERWDELAAEAAAGGIVAVMLGGGDPFMNRDVFDITECFYRRGFRAVMSTKSHVSRTAAERLARIGVERMQVSLDAPTASLADFVTNSPGAFRGAVASIRNLRNAGIKVRTNSVLTAHTVREAPELIAVLVGLGVDIIRMTVHNLSLFVPNNGSLFVDPADSESLAKKVEEIRQTNPDLDLRFRYGDFAEAPPERRQAMFRERPICGAGRWAFVMHSDGKVVLCDQTPLTEPYVVGDVSRQGIQEVWDSPQTRAVLYPPREMFEGTACYDCAEFSECHANKGRCFRDALRAYGSFYAPSPYCPVAPSAQRLA